MYLSVKRALLSRSRNELRIKQSVTNIENLRRIISNIVTVIINNNNNNNNNSNNNKNNNNKNLLLQK